MNPQGREGKEAGLSRGTGRTLMQPQWRTDGMTLRSHLESEKRAGALKLLC